MEIFQRNNTIYRTTCFQANLVCCFNFLLYWWICRKECSSLMRHFAFLHSAKNKKEHDNKKKVYIHIQHNIAIFQNTENTSLLKCIVQAWWLAYVDNNVSSNNHFFRDHFQMYWYNDLAEWMFREIKCPAISCWYWSNWSILLVFKHCSH